MLLCSFFVYALLYIVCMYFVWVYSQEWKCRIIWYAVFIFSSFQSGFVNLYSYQQCKRVSFVPLSYQYLLLPVFIILAFLEDLLPWWLVRLSIFSYVYWPLVYYICIFCCKVPVEVFCLSFPYWHVRVLCIYSTGYEHLLVKCELISSILWLASLLL